MAAGERTEQVAFISAARVLRADGGYDTSDTVGDAMFAAVRAVRAPPKQEADRLIGATTYLVTILADELPAGASTDDSLRWLTAVGGAVDLNIREIRRQPGRDMETAIVCELGVTE